MSHAAIIARARTLTSRWTHETTPREQVRRIVPDIARDLDMLSAMVNAHDGLGFTWTAPEGGTYAFTWPWTEPQRIADGETVDAARAHLGGAR